MSKTSVPGRVAQPWPEWLFPEPGDGTCGYCLRGHPPVPSRPLEWQRIGRLLFSKDLLAYQSEFELLRLELGF